MSGSRALPLRRHAITRESTSPVSVLETFAERAVSSTLERSEIECGGHRVVRLEGELWSSKQRDAASLHEVSYRACFKPHLPRFFVEALTAPGDVVYDPFSGRGTAVLEAALLGRRFISNDVNPLSRIFVEPRMEPPTTGEVADRLASLALKTRARADIDISMFYHRKTEQELMGYRAYFEQRRAEGTEDHVDRWIRMVATNRLTGHSPGFFSVYTFPPNQAVSAESQRRINARRRQSPEYRDTRAIILKKTQQLLRGVTDAMRSALRKAATSGRYYENDARRAPQIRNETVALTVTSPPFLDVVQYADDNWLRCWFNSIDMDGVGSRMTIERTVEGWSDAMGSVFRDLYRITRLGGWVAFEVGEVKNGSVLLDEIVVPLAIDAGFTCACVLVNRQSFTKTANIWGVANNRRGTNSNRIVVIHKR